MVTWDMESKGKMAYVSQVNYYVERLKRQGIECCGTCRRFRHGWGSDSYLYFCLMREGIRYVTKDGICDFFDREG